MVIIIFYTVPLQVLYLQIIIDTPLNYTLLQLLFLQFQCNINKFIWQGGHEKHHFGRYVPHATRNSVLNEMFLQRMRECNKS